LSYPAEVPRGAPVPPGIPGRQRSAEEIRGDIARRREDLGHSVEALRNRVTELTDWRRQLREHRRELLVGAAVAGFVIGGAVALMRRRG
jgi:hypothetical protein